MTMIRVCVKDGLDESVIRPYYDRTMAAERKKRRKTQAERKEDMIKVMVTTEQKRLFTDAADALGLDLSGWIRSLAMTAVAVKAKAEGGKG